MPEPNDPFQPGIPEPPSAPRRAGHWNLAILLALLAALIYTVARSPAPAKGWLTDISAAQAQAVASGRMMLVKFTLPGCPACVVMDRTVLREPEVIDALANFVPVQLDGMREPQLAERYGVYAAPSFVVTDEQGNPLRRLEGVAPVQQFLAFLGSSVSPTSGIVPDLRKADVASAELPPAGP